MTDDCMPRWDKRVTVRQCLSKSVRNQEVTRNQRGPFNWQVRQLTTEGAATRVFIYKSFQWAVMNADRLARGQKIGTYGLRGFHIDYEPRWAR